MQAPLKEKTRGGPSSGSNRASRGRCRKVCCIQCGKEFIPDEEEKSAKVDAQYSCTGFAHAEHGTTSDPSWW